MNSLIRMLLLLSILLVPMLASRLFAGSHKVEDSPLATLKTLRP
jgi:hypothetical protein